MSWHCSQALVEDCSQVDCSAGEPSAPLKSNPTAGECSCKDRTTECLIHSRFGMTCEHLTELPGGARWMSSLRASPASRSVPQESDSEKKTNEICGRKPHEYLAKYDPDGRCWRTSQRSLLEDTLVEFSETWPKSGSMQGGVCFQLPQPGHRTSAIGCLSFATPTTTNEIRSEKFREGRLPNPREAVLWPTPGASKASNDVTLTKSGDGRQKPNKLGWAVAMLPTPTVNGNYNRKGASKKAGDGLATRVGGALNPPWVEWLMGWPIGWTDCEPLATAKFQSWLAAHGASCPQDCESEECDG